jgi:hypothetical protein
MIGHDLLVGCAAGDTIERLHEDELGRKFMRKESWLGIAHHYELSFSAFYLGG